MRLSELEPQFLKATSPTISEPAATLAEADGVIFLCPKCFARNGGPMGTHVMICWKPGIPTERHPRGGRWPMTGSGLDDLTLSPSVQIVGGCSAHFHVQNGEIVGLT